jgi:hypothetical protein
MTTGTIKLRCVLFYLSDEEPPQYLAKLLDYAEVLPRLLASMTEKYREYLQGAVEVFLFSFHMPSVCSPVSTGHAIRFGRKEFALRLK